MEARVVALEAEIRALKRMMAAVAENVLRQLAEKGALLVIPARRGDMEALVQRGISQAVEVNEAEGNTNGGEGTGPISVEEEEGEQEQEEDEDDERDVHRIEPTTSQESVMSSHSTASRSSCLSLRSFDRVTSGASHGGFLPSIGTQGITPRRPVAILAGSTRPSTPVTEAQGVSRPREDSSLIPCAQKVPTGRPAIVAPPRPLSIPSLAPHAVSPPAAPTVVPTPVSMPPHAANQPITTEEWKAPEDFEVPTNVSVAVAWEKWCCGDARLQLPPFRAITHKQISNKAVIRRLSDMRCAMQPIEAIAMAQGLWKPTPTPDEAKTTFLALENQLPLCSGSHKKQIAWSTALNAMRKKRKLDRGK